MVMWFTNLTGHTHFHSLFIKRIKKFIKKGYDPTILQRTACLVVNPFTVGHHASLFACATTGRSYSEIRKRKEYVGYLYYARSVVPLMAALQLLWLQTSHWVHLMTGGNSMFLIWLCFTCNLQLDLLDHWCCGAVGRGKRFIYTVRLIGCWWDKSEVGRP